MGGFPQVPFPLGTTSLKLISEDQGLRFLHRVPSRPFARSQRTLELFTQVRPWDKEGKGTEARCQARQHLKREQGKTGFSKIHREIAFEEVEGEVRGTGSPMQKGGSFQKGVNSAPHPAGGRERRLRALEWVIVWLLRAWPRQFCSFRDVVRGAVRS